MPQRSFSDEEILKRLLFASVNEACKILEEGKAYRASDIDVMWLSGFGLPRYRGGRGYWVAKDKEGLIGGVFRTQKAALRFALFEAAGDSAWSK